MASKHATAADRDRANAARERALKVLRAPSALGWHKPESREVVYEREGSTSLTAPYGSLRR